MPDASLSEPSRLARWIHYQTVKHLPGGGPRIVSEGDSWFQHPTEAEIIDWLNFRSERYKILSLGHAGAWLKEMLRDKEFVDAIEEEEPQVFLFSGGGNDIVEGFLYAILNESEEHETPVQCVNEEVLAHHFDRLKSQYHMVYELAQQAAQDSMGKAIPMIVHGYDYPNPGKKYYGLLDWGVGKTLERRGVREQLWYDVIGLIIDRFNEILEALAHPNALDNMHYVDLRGTLAKEEFVDEMHPTSLGARKLATKVHEKIQDVI